MKQIFEKSDLKQLFESNGSTCKSIKITDKGIEVVTLVSVDAMVSLLKRRGIGVNSVELRPEGLVIDLDVNKVLKKE